MSRIAIILAGLLACSFLAVANSARAKPVVAQSRPAAPIGEGKLETTVKDPAHPDEPWVVTSYIRPDESLEAFARRHREMVEAVRSALR